MGGPSKLPVVTRLTWDLRVFRGGGEEGSSSFEDCPRYSAPCTTWESAYWYDDGMWVLEAPSSGRTSWLLPDKL